MTAWARDVPPSSNQTIKANHPVQQTATAVAIWVSFCGMLRLAVGNQAAEEEFEIQLEGPGLLDKTRVL